jgi:hypothetical protein
MVSQAMMSVVGHDSEIPLGKSSEDKILRDHIFNMVAPYCLSTEDMGEVGAFSKREIDVWLQSFTRTQKRNHLHQPPCLCKGMISQNIFSQRRDISFIIVRRPAWAASWKYLAEVRYNMK